MSSRGDDFTKKVIEKFRVQLLDLSKRNNLISFKHSNKSIKQIRAIDEVITTLFEKLATGEELKFQPVPLPDNIPSDEKNEEFEHKLKEMRLVDEEFHAKKAALGDEPNEREYLQLDLWLRDKARKELGLKPINRTQSITIEEQAKKYGIDSSYDLKVKSKIKKHTDNDIQTLLYPEQLERRLKSISEQSRIYEDEAGINILYMAFGFLEWYDTDTTTSKVITPLILVPISIKRELKDGKYHYSISLRDDEISHNLCLAEKLKKDFGLVLPDYTEGLTQYLESVENLVKNKPQWAVRNFATVGFFAFSKISMYQDLNPQNWSDAKFDEDSLVYSLVNGKDQSEVLFADDYEIDSKKLNAEVPLTVTDADSSQISAILDVLDGKDLVIEGPPGTGKSQTITNIIAAALEKNKKVLFISEKKAALEVVKNRLDKAGLGDFCLELHSSKTKRMDVASSFEQNLSQKKKRRSPPNLHHEVKEIEKIKEEIKKYISCIHGLYSPLGLTYQNVIWSYLRCGKELSEVSSKFEKCRIEGFNQIDAYSVSATKSEIRKFLQYSKEGHAPSENYYSHIWRPFTNSKINVQNNFRFLEYLSQLLKSLTSFYEEFGATKILGDDLKSLTVEQAQHIHTFLESNKNLDIGNIDLEVFLSLKKGNNSEELEKYLENEDRIKEFENNLSNFTKDRLPDLLNITECSLIPSDQSERLHSIKLEDIDSNVTKAVSSIQSLVEAQEKVENVLNLLSIPRPKNKAEYLVLKMFIAELSKLPSFFLAFKTKPLCSFNASVMVGELKRRTNELNDLKRSVAISFNDMGFKLTETETLDLIHEYKNYNIFSWFKSSFRKARKVYKSICVSTLNDKRIAVSNIERLYSFISSYNQHLKSQPFLELVNDPRLGLTPPISEIETTLDVINSFRYSFPETNDFSQSLQDLIVKRENADLDKAVRLLGHKEILGSVDTIVNALAEERIDTVQNCLHKFQKDVDQLKSFSAIEKRFGLKPSLEIKDIYHVHSLVNSYSARINSRETYKSSFSILTLQKDNQVLRHSFNIFKKIYQSNIPESLKRFIFQQTSLRSIEMVFEVSQTLKKCTVNAIDDLREMSVEWGLDCQSLFGKDEYSKVSVHLLIESFMALISKKDLLLPYIQLRESEENLYRLGCKNLFRDIISEKVAFEIFEDLFLFTLYGSILDDFFKVNFELKKNMGISLTELRRLFKEQDSKLTQLQRLKLSHQLLNNEVYEGNSKGRVKEYTEMGFINHQISLQRGHAPIRDYFSRAPMSTLAVKPCLMMSPLSISQYLPSKDFYFDLVVMDEASQLKPEDAIGAILRARQVVVVGDPKQLPPTNFFNFTSDTNQQNEDEEDVELPDYESILDMALKSFRPARRLKWHYRSKHENLISFSNKSFYQGDLVIFPSPHYEHEDFGLHYKYIENGVYQGRKNVVEAQEIVKYVLNHVEKLPNRSLGIVTINQAQQELLVDLLDMEMRQNVVLQDFLTKHENSLEPLIIKNLENIQGDERDVILISTVYGKEPGATKFHQRFGPINGKMGHRRLNVLFTRARYKTLVFSSLDPDLIIADDSSSYGLRVFKDFLTFAKYKKENIVTSTGDVDSDFELFVKNAIQEHGFVVNSQIGVSGYRIDLGIVHPSLPGKYLMGIECDGATYHSSKSARDRDKTRQEILESLGWKIYRIWSTDWFNDPQKEIEKLLKEIRKFIS